MLLTIPSPVKLARIALPSFAAFILLQVYWFAISQPSVGLIHDDGIYLVTAKSLAEGHGFRIESLPDDAFQTKYGPVYPSLLAVAWKFFPRFPQNTLLLKLVTAFWLVPWLWFSYLLLTKHLSVSAHAALWICTITAALPASLTASASLMSELPFAAFLALGLLLMARAESEKVASIKTAAACAAALAVAYLTRASGLAFILGGGIPVFRQRNRKARLAYVGISIAAIAGWTGWQIMHPDSYVLPALRYYTGDAHHDWNVLLAGGPPSQMLQTVVKTAGLIFVGPRPLMSGLGLLPGTWFLWAGCAAFWVTVFYGVTKPGPRALLYALAIYAAVLLSWRWYPDRFLLPTYPLLLGYAWRGLPKWGRAPAIAVCLLGVTVSLVLFVRATDCAQYSTTASEAQRWTSQAAAHEWIKDHAEPGSVIGANYDPAIYLYTGHPAVRPYVADPEAYYGRLYSVAEKTRQFEEVLRLFHVRYWIETGHDGGEDPDYRENIRQASADGTVALIASPAPEVRVFEVQNQGKEEYSGKAVTPPAVPVHE